LLGGSQRSRSLEQRLLKRSAPTGRGVRPSLKAREEVVFVAEDLLGFNASRRRSVLGEPSERVRLAMRVEVGGRHVGVDGLGAGAEIEGEVIPND
jgi:hypothetical protein